MPLIEKPFIFMRHGETDANKKNVFCGATDLPLNDTGREQAINARTTLVSLYSEDMTVISSSMLRARETTKLALPDISYITNPGLAERHWGELEMTALSPVSYFDTPPDGESWPDFIARVTTALNTILTNYEKPLIIAHSGVYRVIQFYLTGSPAGQRIPNATPVRFWPESNVWQQKIIME